jgi:hypothetical protein
MLVYIRRLPKRQLLIEGFSIEEPRHTGAKRIHLLATTLQG